MFQLLKPLEVRFSIKVKNFSTFYLIFSVFTTTSKLSTASKPITTKTTKKTTSKAPKTTISKAKTTTKAKLTSKSTTTVKMGSKLPLVTSTPSSSNYTTPSLPIECLKLKIPDIKPYITQMKEKSTDLCDKAKFYYVDYVNREPNYLVFTSKLKDRIMDAYTVYNASYNITYRAIRNATGLSSDDFATVFTNGGFADLPMSCFNKLIFMLKIEHGKLVGRFNGAMQQLNILFKYYHSE